MYTVAGIWHVRILQQTQLVLDILGPPEVWLLISLTLVWSLPPEGMLTLNPLLCYTVGQVCVSEENM